MEMIEAELDIEHHLTSPYMEDGHALHYVLPGNRKQSVQIKRITSYDRACWDPNTDIEEVGVTPDGRWFLLRTSDKGTEVLEFPNRRELCLLLWDCMGDEPGAIHSLYQLGALKFDADGYRAST